MSKRYFWQRIFSIFVLTGMVLSFLQPAAALASAPAAPKVPEQQVDGRAKIEQLVLDEIAAEGQTDFFVWMAEKADLSPAYAMKTKAEKGTFVFNTLVETAVRTQKGVRQLLDSQGVQYEAFYIANKILVRGGSEALALNLAARSDIAEITANHQYQLQEPFISPKAPEGPEAIEPNLTFVNADDVWGMGVTGSNTVLAGNDTGLDWDHPALINQYRGWDGSTADHNFNWWDATGTYPTVPGDGHGHGTHTTGTMVGDDGAGNQIGMAPGAQTIHCKNMTDGGSGDDSTFTECFQWDLAPWDLNGQGADPLLAPDAVNNSWGYWGGNQPQFKDEIEALQAAGILIEVSAGNEGSACTTLRSPGDYEMVVTTGSVNHVSGVLPGTLTGFSSRGPSLIDEGFFPDVMAPGENIRSSVPGGGFQGGWSGTSMAGPHVVGLVGLMWSANPALRGNVEMTNMILKDTAVPLVGQGGSNCGGDYTEGPNNDWGYGTIDSYAAVQMALAFGGTGTLEGTVTDSSNSNPIEDAQILATLSPTMSWMTESGPDGFYSLVVLSGTYDVEATAFGYFPETVSGVEVISGSVTVQDFALDPAPSALIYGYVTDVNTGWPLFASVAIAGVPGSPFWTDPETGYYEVSLPEGETYDLHVEAWVAGYVPADATVGPLSGDTQVDFALDADQAACVAPGYTSTAPLNDDFDPDGFAGNWTVINNGGDCVWRDDNPGGRTNNTGGSGRFAIADSDYCGFSGYMNTELRSPVFDASTQPTLILEFKSDYPYVYTGGDVMAVDVFNGTSWVNVLYRSGTPYPGPETIQIDITAAAGGATNAQVRFHYYNAFWEFWWEVDDVKILGECLPPVDGGLVVGNVYDANTMDPLVGADVANDAGFSTVTAAEPAGFYTLFSPSGLHAFGAWADGYVPGYADVDVWWYDTVRQDFYLNAGWLTGDPESMQSTLPWGGSETQQLTLSNLGGAEAFFDITEKDGGWDPVLSAKLPIVPVERSIPGGFDSSAFNAQGIDAAGTQPLGILAAGDVLAQWPTGLALPWGTNYDSDDDTVWFSNPGIAGGDDNDHEYATDGTATGRTVYALFGGDWAGDMAFNQNTGMMWQVNVGGDNCLYELDPASGLTGNFVCGPWGISQRGVAYDPETDSFFVGGWNEGIVYHIDSTGSLIQSWNLGLSIAGLAFNTEADYLFIIENSPTDVVTVVDVNAGVIVDTFSIPGFGNYVGAGLEIDCDGNLWAANQGNGNAYLVDSGVPASLCVSDVPWVSEDPISGTVPGGGNMIPLNLPTLPAVEKVAAIPSGIVTSATGNGEPATPAAAPEAVLWDQPSANTSAVIDQYFPDFGAGVFSADEFVLADTVAVSSIFVDGYTTNPGGLNNASALYWVLFSDEAGLPDGYPGDNAVAVWSFASVPGAPGVTIGGPNNAQITLDVVAATGKALSLAPGTYWLSFFPSLSFTTYGQWFWDISTTTNGATGQVIDPYGLIGLPSTWTSWSTLNPAYYDAAFRLEGEVVEPQAVVDVTFDAAAVEQPGSYYATLRINNDTPYGALAVPVTMTVEPAATMGKLLGNVYSLGYCDAEMNPLDKALVVIEGSNGFTVELETDELGYYQYWLDEAGNPYTVTASFFEHESVEFTINITGGGQLVQDFMLRWLYPCVTVDPGSLAVTLDWGDSETLPTTLGNTGAADTDFEIKEKDGGFTPALLGMEIQPAERSILKGFEANAVTSKGSIDTAGTQPAALPHGILAAGDVLAQWPTGLVLPWGTNYDSDDDTVWFSNPGVAGGDDNDHEYATDGTATGRMVYALFGGGSWAGDMAFNQNTGMMWQVNVGGDNCLYELDPASGLTGNFVCGPWSISQRGVAYDPETDSFFVGGWNEGIVYHIDSTGSLIQSWNLGLSIAGLAFNTEADYLFIIENSPTDVVTVVDVNAGAVVNTFSIPGFGNYVGAGLEIDCDGNLWAANQGNGNAYLVDSGVPASLCKPPDVPWVSEDPITGTLPADTGEQMVDVTFDSSVVLQPGDYFATLNIKTDDPMYGTIGVPVTMTVVPPTDWGKVEGVVLDSCTAEPLEEVWVSFPDGFPITSTMTAEDGSYYAWLASGTYEFTFSFPDYLTYTTLVEVLPGGALTVLDVNLIPDRPCIAVDPDMLEAWLVFDQQSFADPTGLELTNNGGQDLSWAVFEMSPTLSLATVSIPAGPASVPAGTAVAAGGVYTPQAAQTYTVQGRSAPDAAPNVLLLHSDDGNGEPIRSQLQAFGDLGVVDVYDARSGTPTLPELQAYDVVVTWSNYVYSDPNGIGNVLADYVDAGGKVINLMFSMGTSGWQMGGRFMSENYTAVNGVSNLYSTSCLGAYDPSHPIMEGVTDVCDLYRLSGTYLTPGSSQVAAWQDGQIFVGAKDDRTVVSITGYVGFYKQWTGQMDAVVHNAILYLATPPYTDIHWIWEIPITGTVAAQGAQTIDVYYSAQYTDSTPMPLGDYFAGLVIENDDPVARTQEIPVTMHIVAEFVDPVPSFVATTPVNWGETMIFSNTTIDGVPPVDYFVWDFGDGETMMTDTMDPVSHVYANYGTFEVTLTAYQKQTGAMFTFTDMVEVLPAYVEVAHLAPFAADPGTAVTVTLDGAPVLTGFEFADSTGYLAVQPGVHLLEVFPQGSPVPAMTATVDLGAAEYSVIATGDGVNQPLALVALLDDNSAPAAGSFKLRLGHFAPFASGSALADVRLQDGTIVLDDVPFGAVAPYLELAAGEYDLMITTPDGSVTLIDPLPVTFNDGDIVSAFAVGEGSNQALGVFAWPAGVEGFLLPLGTANVQVAHLAPFAADPGTAVTVMLDGAELLTGFEFADSTPYVTLGSGRHVIEIYPAGASDPAALPAITGSVDLEAGMDYTVLAVGDGVNQPLELVALMDDNSAPAAGNFKLRIGHFAPFAPGLALADVRLDDGTVVLDDVAFGDVAPYLELAAGEYDLRITSPDGSVVYIDIAPVTLADGQILSVFAVGEGVNQALGAFALPSGEVGFLLPLEEGFMIFLPFVNKHNLVEP